MGRSGQQACTCAARVRAHRASAVLRRSAARAAARSQESTRPALTRTAEWDSRHTPRGPTKPMEE
eukprot:15435634-Alexandrium_andersonii.AAC.1